MCVRERDCVYVCERERERERDCVCVCVRERKREGERERERGRGVRGGREVGKRGRERDLFGSYTGGYT